MWCQEYINGDIFIRRKHEKIHWQTGQSSHAKETQIGVGHVQLQYFNLSFCFHLQQKKIFLPRVMNWATTQTKLSSEVNVVKFCRNKKKKVSSLTNKWASLYWFLILAHSRGDSSLTVALLSQNLMNYEIIMDLLPT